MEPATGLAPASPLYESGSLLLTYAGMACHPQRILPAFAPGRNCLHPSREEWRARQDLHLHLAVLQTAALLFRDAPEFWRRGQDSTLHVPKDTPLAPGRLTDSPHLSVEEGARFELAER